MPEIKIALYGGTALSTGKCQLVEHLARSFLADPHVVLVGGGIYDRLEVKTSVDFAACRAAEAYIKETGKDIEDRLQTWLPETKRPGIERAPWGTPVRSMALQGHGVSSW